MDRSRHRDGSRAAFELANSEIDVDRGVDEYCAFEFDGCVAFGVVLVHGADYDHQPPEHQ